MAFFAGVAHRQVLRIWPRLVLQKLRVRGDGSMPDRRNLQQCTLTSRRHGGCNDGGMTSPTDFADPQTYAIIGAAMEVHRTLGCGFLESVYRRALVVEFLCREIGFASEVAVTVSYKGETLPGAFRADFICDGSILVEVKALSAIGNAEIAQTLNYLKAANLHRALLLNFGAPRFQHRRIVRELPAAHDPVPGTVRTPAILRVGPLIDAGAAERPDEPPGIPADGDDRGGSADTGRQ
jgi:GxxExxY protein